MAREKLNIFITLIVALCAAMAGWKCWEYRVCQQLVVPWAHGQAKEFKGVAALRTHDANFRSVSAGRNLVIQFVNFDANDPGQLRFVQELFGRGAYALYPRRVWVVSEGTVLNGGRDVLSAQFSPTLQWLWEHDVRAIVEMTSGNDSPRIIPVPPGGAP